VLQFHPDLQGCVAYCAGCGIRFLTHPRNAGRRNLRCPFGCRRHHRRERSCQRSAAYYRTGAGKAKKKRLNARRQGRQVLLAPPPPAGDSQGLPPDPQADAPPASASWPGPAELRLDGVVLDESSVAHSPMVPYVRMVVSLIAGIAFTCREVVHLLRLALRQHSIGARRARDYLLDALPQRPP
jgi:hypothetical protein